MPGQKFPNACIRRIPLRFFSDRYDKSVLLSLYKRFFASTWCDFDLDDEFRIHDR